MSKKKFKPWKDSHGAIHFENVTVQTAPLSLFFASLDYHERMLKKREDDTTHMDEAKTENPKPENQLKNQED